MEGGKLNLCLACRDVQASSAGGLAHATRDLAEALARSGHEVHLLTNRSSAALPDLAGVSIHPLFMSPASGRFADAALDTAPHNIMHAAAVYREVRRIHEQERPVDAVVAPLWRSEGAVCILDHSFPTIVSCMTSIRTLTELGDEWRLIPDIRERVSLEREALRRCQYLHGLTHAALAKTIGDYGLEPASTAVIGRGLRDRRPQARAVAAGDGPLRVLFVGRIERRKGVDTLLAAARELIDERADLTFTLVGPNADPGYRASFEDEASRDSRLAAAIRFTGGVSDSELIRLYCESDIVCLPSRYESHGIALIEAMMFGKPILTCDAGGIGEVVQAGRDALLVAPEDPDALAAGLRRLASDPGLRSRLGAAARETFERRLDVGRAAVQMQTFIEQVIALHNGLDAACDGVAGRLERLLDEVLTLKPGEARAACEELLDPSMSAHLRRTRTHAGSFPAPRPTAVGGRPRLTAVILTRDRSELLGRALDSIQHSRVPLEILVIDNASSPPGAGHVAAECARRPRVKLRRSDRNLGCAGGRRLGAQLADTEFVLFVDDDAELLPGALEHLVAELDAHPSVGAVAATVVGPQGLVMHSGGRLERTAGLATFELIGAGLALDDPRLPASGPADWVPGTAVLVRRALLEEFEIDAGMSAYFEDNEWCYRVLLERPGCFRRSREALAFHHFQVAHLGSASFDACSTTVNWVAACARFYERHRVLLAPAVFDLIPELRDDRGACDLAAARLLMELVAAKGPEWTLIAWTAGDLGAMFDRHRRHHAEGQRAQAELLRLRQTIASQGAALKLLQHRHEVLSAIEQGGWWRLRSRILLVLRFAERPRSRGGRRVSAGPAPTIQIMPQSGETQDG